MGIMRSLGRTAASYRKKMMDATKKKIPIDKKIAALEGELLREQTKKAKMEKTKSRLELSAFSGMRTVRINHQLRKINKKLTKLEIKLAKEETKAMKQDNIYDKYNKKYIKQRIKDTK